MKKYFQQKIIKLLMMTAIIVSAFSFKSFAGGDTYEIYLNDKLICKQQYKQLTGSTDFSINKLNENDRLVIKYSHCGEVGKNRCIVIKDENEKIIKEWKFTDMQDKQSVMQIPVKELLALKAKNGSLKIYYSAKQLPAGKMLAAVTIDNKKVALNTIHQNNTAFLFALKHFFIVQYFA